MERFISGFLKADLLHGPGVRKNKEELEFQSCTNVSLSPSWLDGDMFVSVLDVA